MGALGSELRWRGEGRKEGREWGNLTFWERRDEGRAEGREGDAWNGCVMKVGMSEMEK